MREFIYWVVNDFFPKIGNSWYIRVGGTAFWAVMTYFGVVRPW